VTGRVLGPSLRPGAYTKRSSRPPGPSERVQVPAPGHAPKGQPPRSLRTGPGAWRGDRSEAARPTRPAGGRGLVTGLWNHGERVGVGYVIFTVGLGIGGGQPTESAGLFGGVAAMSGFGLAASAADFDGGVFGELGCALSRLGGFLEPSVHA
jgi:hypothetical protein